MPHRLIDRIRRSILLRDYALTIHAIEEMAEDDLDILDIEHAVLTGQIARRYKHDPRGTNTQFKAWLLMVNDWLVL